MIKDEVFVTGIGLGGGKIGYEFQKKNYPTMKMLTLQMPILI